MIYRRGDVVMVDHPFSDTRGSKVRPMLVVQSDVRNQQFNHSVVAMATTNLGFVGGGPTQVLVDITTPDGAGSGLSATSAIQLTDREGRARLGRRQARDHLVVALQIDADAFDVDLVD
jgi:mRNA-degrading endonuclease toxin of MazEF toxin-antitoxin module